MSFSFNCNAKTMSIGRFRFQWGGYKNITAMDVDALEDTVNSFALSADRMDIYKANIDSVSVSSLETDGNISLASQTLEDNGIVIVPGFLSDAAVQDAKEAIDEAYAIVCKEKGGDDYEDKRIYVHNSGKKFRSYKDLQNYSKAVADVRKGKDDGMVDVFNIDKFRPKNFEKLRAALESPAILKLLSDSGNETLSPANLNVYINDSITSTRGFHIDTERKNLKAFIYLTDVQSLDMGPYCYVRGTHKKDNSAKIFNKKLVAGTGRHNTDTPFIDPACVTPALASKGTLVISDQSGIHRGFPQKQGAKRCVAVMRYL